MLVWGGIVEITIRMQCREFAQDLPEFQVNIERSKIGCFNKCFEPRSETIQGP